MEFGKNKELLNKHVSEKIQRKWGLFSINGVMKHNGKEKKQINKGIKMIIK